MSSYRQILYHIVFRTKNGKPAITNEHKKELYAYILGIIKNKGCVLYRINGVENHIHILSDLHPSISLADYLQVIKSNSSKWMRESGKFPFFRGWASGYGGFTVSMKDKDRVVNYIINQEQHHKQFSFEEEYRKLLSEYEIEFDERYFLSD